MKNSRVGLLSVACTGYFVLMQAINLNTLSVSAVEAEVDKKSLLVADSDSMKEAVTPMSSEMSEALTKASRKVSVAPRMSEREVDFVVKMPCWALGDVQIYAEPCEDGAVVGKLVYQESILCTEYSDNWVEVEQGYIRVQDISFSEPMYRSVFIPSHKDFKSYMDYRTIKTCLQKDLQDIAETNSDGFRVYEGRYCVAVGTACNAMVGDYIDLVLENGTIIPAIVGDIKADIHTEANNLITSANGCCSEFIIDMDVMSSRVKKTGSVSNAYESWQSAVVEIRVLGGGVFK